MSDSKNEIKQEENKVNTYNLQRKSITPPTDYLVFTGGGVRTFSYIGTLQQLSQEWGQRWWKSLKGYYAVSAGSILSFMLCLDFPVESLVDILFHFPFEKLFQPHFDCLLDKWCLDDSQQLHLFLKSILAKKNLPESTTLLEFYKKTNQELHIIVSNLTRARPDIWSHLTTPDIPIIKAIITSCAIPFIFPFVTHEEQVFVDGAYYCPFPFTLVPEIHHGKSLGIYSHENSLNHIQYIPKTFKEYFGLCFTSSREFIMNPYRNANFWKYTIQVQIPDIEIIDFELSPQQRSNLLNYGINAANSFMSSK